ncbi:MAG: CPBP family intramembrane metalloprotease [Flavobacteriales bacterium]|nr:CPBP family intramembrane metalloprotease [Flavobacteriales bacterium]
MKALYNAVADFVKKDFNGSVYGITILFLAVAMFINYSKGIDLNWFDTREGFNSRLGYYGLLFGGTYFITTLLAAKGAEKAYLKDWRFWILAISFVFIATIPKLHILKLIDVRAHGWNLHEMVFASRSHFFFHQMVISLVGLGIVKLLFHKWVTIDYGFRADWKTLKPYFFVLALVAPLVIGASFFPDFQRAYPQYKPWDYTNVFNLSFAQQTTIFEICYSTGFVAVEAIFRGALAITMIKVMGSRAVLAMASFYCVFHFGKPAGEAVGAFFGGYALGVLAIHSRSVLGGLIVHLGVAMLMESMGYLHYFF